MSDFKGAQALSLSGAGSFVEQHFRALMGAGAAISLVLSIISMAIIYGDPLAHIRVCLGGQPEVASGFDGLLLYGHCGWCYLAAGMALAAIVLPGKKKA